MADFLRPSGALLAALALWALGLLVLGFAGLGGRVGPHPPNAALAPPIPQVTLVELAPRLGPLGVVAEVGQRPLLSPDRRPSVIAAAAEGPAEAPLEATLTSVLIAGDTRLAIVQNKDDPVPRRVRVGEVIEGTSWRLVDLQPRRALFEGPMGQRTLDLRVFDGTGAPMPAEPAVPAPVAAAPGNATAPPAVTTDTAATPAPALPALPATFEDEPRAELTPEQQVEAIRRRIEARRAMRAQEGAEDRAALERNKQVQ